MSRKLDDWLKHWLDFSSAWVSPERFRLWAGISAISAALQRKCWTVVCHKPLFPNMYVLLVGPPGIGKGNAMNELRTWLREIKSIKVAPDSLTKRSFYSTLEGAKVEVELTDDMVGCSAEEYFAKTHHSLTAFVEELGVFLQPGDNDFIWPLCHVYDCPPILQHKTQHAGENLAHDIYFSMLSACTPKALKDIFTDRALETGISARTVIVFSDEKVKVPIFGSIPGRDDLGKDLKHDLGRISRIRGEFVWDDEAAEELVTWVDADMKPLPKDPRFEHYNSRRFVQCCKLCMCCAASKRQDTVILAEDVFQSKTFLLEAERVMPRAVESIGANPYLIQQQTAIKFIHQVFNAEKRGVAESDLRRRLNTELDPRYSDSLIDELAKARWVSTVGKAPNRIFYPRTKDGIDAARVKGNTSEGPAES